MVGILMTVGYLLELGGLAAAAWGLRKTWADNADGMHFLEGTPRLHATWRWLLRQNRPVTGSAVLVGTTGIAVGVGIVGHPSIEGATTAQRLDLLEQDMHEALSSISRLRNEVGEEAKARELGDAELSRRVSATEQTAKAYTRRLIVEGVPQAVLGLAAAVLGLLCQGLASWNPLG